MLDRLATTVARTIPDAEAVSVTLVPGDPDRSARTAAATHQVVVGIDTDQYAVGEGPSLEAARDRQPIRVSVEEIRDRWPRFARSADRPDAVVSVGTVADRP